MANPHPWTCWQHGFEMGSRATRLAAQGLVERPWRPGNAMVRNQSTGEEWHRRNGSWFKTQDHWSTKDKAALGAEDPRLPRDASPARHRT